MTASTYIIIHFIVIVILELPVLLYFFREDKLSALHFTLIANAVTFFLTHSITTKLGLAYYPTQLLMALLEGLFIYFFWTIDFKKALLISFIANAISLLGFALLDHYYLANTGI